MNKLKTHRIQLEKHFKFLFVIVLIVGLSSACSSAADDVSNSGNSSNVFLDAPRDGSNLFQSEIELFWNDPNAPSNLGYRVQVATDQNFSAVLIDEQTKETSLAFTLSNDQEEYTLFWRVSKIQDDNTLGQWSNHRTLSVILNSVKLSRPVQSSPTNNRLPQFVWQANEFADSYIIRVSNDAQMDSILYSSEISQTEIMLPENNILPVTDNTNYYWVVIPVIDGVQGKSSSIETFVLDTTPPEMPAVNKEPGRYNMETTFSSVTVTNRENGAGVYYTISRNGVEPNDPDAEGGQPVDSSNVISGIAQNGITHLKVIQRDEAGNFSAVNHITFDIKTEPPTITVDKDSGRYNMDSYFDRLIVGISGQDEVYYTISNDGTDPAPPTPDAGNILTATANTITGINLNGTTKINMLPVDRYGNLGELLYRQFDIDTTAPDILDVAINNNQTVTHYASFPAQITASDNSGIAEIQILAPDSDDNGSWIPFSETITVNNNLLYDVNNATIDVGFVVKDEFGNLSEPFNTNIELSRTLITDAATMPLIWSQNGPYIIRGDVTVAAGDILDIDNTEIIFDGEYQVRIEGGATMNNVVVRGTNTTVPMFRFTPLDFNNSSIDNMDYFGTGISQVLSFEGGTGTMQLNGSSFEGARIELTGNFNLSAVGNDFNRSEIVVFNSISEHIIDSVSVNLLLIVDGSTVDLRGGMHQQATVILGGALRTTLLGGDLNFANIDCVNCQISGTFMNDTQIAVSGVDGNSIYGVDLRATLIHTITPGLNINGSNLWSVFIDNESGVEIDARDNYWGTTDLNVINGNLSGPVAIEPILNSPAF